jgi:SAM-dependent methyltransferase
MGEPTTGDWAAIHSQGASWRKKIIGEINDVFVIPRYVQFFYESLGSARQCTFFEIGSGNGDMSRAILAANRGQIARYVTSESFPQGVEWLRAQGLEAILADAMHLPVNDQEFDVAVEFDVMHHVQFPERMAAEMMRIGRGKCLLVESNGLSIFRKIKELTPGHRAAGEKSYTPQTYRGFFTRHTRYSVKLFRIFPFLFPFKCPSKLLPALVRFNRWIETVPILRWQCSSVAIYIEYERKQNGQS